MPAGSVIDIVARFLIRHFWPWFLENVWPLVQRAIVEIFVKGIGALTQSAKGTIDDRMSARESDAAKNAASAEAAASTAGNKSERDRQEAIAAVWREVAEQFRSENESLKRQLDAMSSKTVHVVRGDLDRIAPGLENLDGQPSVVIAGRTTVLPALTYDGDPK